MYIHGAKCGADPDRLLSPQGIDARGAFFSQLQQPAQSERLHACIAANAHGSILVAKEGCVDLTILSSLSTKREPHEQEAL